MNKKKLVTMLVVFGALSMTALGAWIISFSTADITGNVISDADAVVYVVDDFTALGEIDVTTASQQVVKNATIQNDNGNLTFNIVFNETRLDIVDGCTDYLNDVVISYKFNGLSINASDVVTVPSGLSNIEATFDVIRSACPQNISVSTLLTEV